MIMNIGLTSRAFPRALPASASSSLFARSSSVMLVFTCAQKCMHNNNVILAVIKRESVTSKSGKFEFHLERLGDSFSALRAKLCCPTNSDWSASCLPAWKNSRDEKKTQIHISES